MNTNSMALSMAGYCLPDKLSSLPLRTLPATFQRDGSAVAHLASSTPTPNI
jgi:hypothetical protein